MNEVVSEQMESRLRELGSRERFEFPSDVVPDSFRRAAVLIPFWRERGELFVVLTQRASKLRTHAGMVAFPGGGLDPGESWADAAVREAHEEVGLDPALVEILGPLDDAWSGAKHHLVPIVAWIDSIPQFVANPDEVSRVIIAPVTEIMRPGARSDETVYLGSLPCIKTTIALTVGDVYGLTADLLLEAIEWATGENHQRGQVRLRELEAFNANGQQPARLSS
jgi:8-oxo-dGTP pyrophosphatase MutT (NUDIX family)